MKILIIEDELGIRQVLQELLELNGHVVLAAGNGAEGIKLAGQSPDLILCDIGMPGMDGYEVIAAIRQLRYCGEVPFIFLTAKADRDDHRRGMALGADDYITKPFNEREILDAIAARVRRQQPLRERIEQLLAERRFVLDANWSHELMTPLNGVMGGLALIEAEADTIRRAELKELLGLIRAGAERQHSLSRKLVLHYELERLKTKPAMVGPCDARSAVMSGAARAAQEQKREADLTVRCDHGAVPLAEAYLLAAVTEVVANAFRFSKAGQAVMVAGTNRVSHYEIQVTDEGIGMTPEQCAGVAAFVQYGRSQLQLEGLGLGLAIARSVAEIAGGRFRLQHGPNGRGLQVTFDLPCV